MAIKNKNQIIEECILSLANGDTDAMDLLYETIKKDVYSLALSKVCNKFDADDILQETFVRIYQNAKLYTPQGKPMAWIVIVESNVINRFYQLNVRRETLSDDAVYSAKDECEVTERDIKDDYLVGLLAKLSEFEREVISLHLVSNMKFRQIAEVLDKPLSTILSKYNRAIKKLQKIVKEEK